MVSFQCESCGETLKKPKLESHTRSCHQAQFTCIDCSVTFEGVSYRQHTSCISEEQKYHKSVYKPPKGKGGQQQQQNGGQPSANAQGKKRAREDEETPSTSEPATEVTAPEVTTEEGAEETPSKKKSKKDKKKKKDVETSPAPFVTSSGQTEQTLAIDPHLGLPGIVGDIVVQPDLERAATAALAYVPPTPPLPVASTSTSTVTNGTTPSNANGNNDDQPAPTVHAFLGQLLPTLLTDSHSLANLRDLVIAEAAKSGWTDGESVGRAFLEGVWIGGDKPKKMLVLNFARTAKVKAQKKSKGDKKGVVLPTPPS